MSGVYRQLTVSIKEKIGRPYFCVDRKAIAARLTNCCLSFIREQCRTKATIQDTENVNRVSTDASLPRCFHRLGVAHQSLPLFEMSSPVNGLEDDRRLGLGSASRRLGVGIGVALVWKARSCYGGNERSLHASRDRDASQRDWQAADGAAVAPVSLARAYARNSDGRSISPERKRPFEVRHGDASVIGRDDEKGLRAHFLGHRLSRPHRDFNRCSRPTPQIGSLRSLIWSVIFSTCRRITFPTRIQNARRDACPVRYHDRHRR